MSEQNKQNAPAGSEQTPAVDENHIIAERRAKLAKWRESGKAYPNDFRRKDLADKLHAGYGEKTTEELEAAPVVVSVAGRIMLKRVMGKASAKTSMPISRLGTRATSSARPARCSRPSPASCRSSPNQSVCCPSACVPCPTNSMAWPTSSSAIANATSI
jgi:hypothetical protein